jgi:hypothetical protein
MIIITRGIFLNGRFTNNNFVKVAIMLKIESYIPMITFFIKIYHYDS